MIHHILRFLLQITFWVYYRKLDIQGLDNVPLTGPVILACNHPNSFLDALVVGLRQKRRLHFLARSDVFNTPLKNWILGQMSLLPIYRLQEGLENLEKNKETFSKCNELLDNDGMILIFSEGLCIQELRLRPLKKGTARIAMQYINSGRNKTLTIVPVGLNYLKPMTPREEVMISMARPFVANEFAELYSTNSGRAINEFSKLLEERLKETVIDIKDREHSSELTQVLEIKRNDGEVLSSLIDFAKRASALNSTHPDRYRDMVKKAGVYKSRLIETGMTDAVVKDTRQGSLLLPLLAPIYLVGFVLNGLPWFTALRLAKTKVKKVEFYDSVLVGAFMFLNVFHQLFIFLILLFIHPLLALIVLGILLTTAMISTLLYDPLQRNRLLLIKGRVPKEKMAGIEKLREELVQLTKLNP